MPENWNLGLMSQKEACISVLLSSGKKVRGLREIVQTAQGYRTSSRLHDVQFIQAAESWETSYDGDLSQMGCSWGKSSGGVNGEGPGQTYFTVTSRPGRTLDFLNPKIHGFETFKDYWY